MKALDLDVMAMIVAVADTGNISRAAEVLGLERSHLYKKCQQLGIDLRAVRYGL